MRAAFAGRVAKIWLDDPTRGTAVLLAHGNGLTTAYLHLSRVYVVLGQHVAIGQVLGLSGGQRGAWGAGRSTGPHLHFGVFVNGTPINPVPAVRWTDAVHFRGDTFGCTCEDGA